MDPEPELGKDFRAWLVSHGGHFHPNFSVVSGLSIVATEPVAVDATIVSCPLSLVITSVSSRSALSTVLGDESVIEDWNERQLISTYLCFHWILDTQSHAVLKHLPYLNTLPPPPQLRTPLHFTQAELDALKGTNLYGATLDRRSEWEAEWLECRKGIMRIDASWHDGLTWERYLAAATYLSSRAFPSTLISQTPSLVVTDSSEPVLLPGVDSLNHARGQPVSWVVNSLDPSTSPESALSISLVSHAAFPAGAEVFNNYGPKPNAELILGYGFATPENPDDTIVLKIGGHGAQGGNKWEVGRDARGIEGLWEEIVAAVRSHATEGEQDEDAPSEWDIMLEAAELLTSMSTMLLSRLPEPSSSGAVRPDVAMMIEYYVSGQRDILTSILGFAEDKEADAVTKSSSEGGVLHLDEDLVEEDEEAE
ncbi:SET domain-containing protein [Artomyces pyxidatus]|uniref:SET domain-containing protein n=1 Tax=Artomyces pyxidatus TaxID=48021 RepID=A0ACB8TAH6_9AGAM|nr:SET domain-containing protein [Artomyces pyxidatus]